MTVQHTGSSFFCRLLEGVYGPYGNLKTPRERFYYDHLWPHKMPLIYSRLRGRKLVTTIRDKDATRESWVRRGVHELEDFEAQWAVWERIVDKADCVVSIDDNRDERLAALSRLIGVELQTDWAAVNAST